MRAFLMSFALIAVLIVALTAQSANDPAWRPKTSAPPSLVPPGTPAPGNAQSAAIAEVIAFEKATEAAVVRGDTAFLEKALAPTFLFTHGDGWVDGGAPLKVDTKASWIEYVKRQPSPYIYRELDHVQVELHGDIAITLGRYFYLPQSNGQANHMHVWFERLYAKRNGQWQMLSHRTVKGPVRNDAVKTSSTQ
jgi:uncharacterized protein DUF4440